MELVERQLSYNLKKFSVSTNYHNVSSFRKEYLNFINGLWGNNVEISKFLYKPIFIAMPKHMRTDLAKIMIKE